MNTLTISPTVVTNVSDKEDWRGISSRSPFFNNENYYTFKSDAESLTIIKHYMEVPKGARKFTKPCHVANLQIKMDIPIGTFDFDAEESNEDIVKIYY